MIPASIRYKNPGAMWGSPLAQKWGAEKKAVSLNDGKGQGNNIAVFPTYVQGICAQIDLWRTSPRYKNKPFREGIAVWSGGNSVPSYLRIIEKRVPGMTGDTIMNDQFWRSDMAIPFLKAQAFHEAGREYPAPDSDFQEALRIVLSRTGIPGPVRHAPGPIAVGATYAVFGWQTAVFVAVAIGVGYIVYRVLKQRSQTAQQPNPSQSVNPPATPTETKPTEPVSSPSSPESPAPENTGTPIQPSDPQPEVQVEASTEPVNKVLKNDDHPGDDDNKKDTEKEKSS